MRSNPKFILLIVILLAAVAGFFIYPNGLGNKILPWRLGLDLIGGSYLVYETDMSSVASADRNSVLDGLRDVFERRVNAFGVSEPRVTTAKKGESYQLTVELAGIKDLEEAIREIGRTALLDFRTVEKDGENLKFNKTELTGRYLKSAQVTADQTLGTAQISISFNTDGARIFEELTGQNTGKPLAIFLDDQLISMPTVQEKISGGNAQITGQFSFQEAKNLVSLFNAGALPAPVKLISQQTIGASLGIDSLKKSVYAGLIGTAAIILFMMLYYRRLGIFSSIALIIYAIFTLAIFKLFGVTMSLSGIAGFILSIGMAVDANILIFARMKEEIKKGLSAASALEEGFQRAWTSIRDSNISTILTSVILYYWTSSFVKGFALALLIGVLISMFSAITVTRAIMRSFIK